MKKSFFRLIVAGAVFVCVAQFSFSQAFIKMNVGGTDSSAQSPVRLAELSASAEVMGNIAVTTLDMLFVNETNRVLEGELEFPLGENESVVGYALDINGKMRQGVVVEKDKGRQVFEAVVRQGIDPGLVERTSGNNFKTRVYPLPASGSRRVQVTYQSELKAQSARKGAASSQTEFFRTYQFSALPEGTLDEFNFKIAVLDAKRNSESGRGILDADGGRYLTFGDMTSGYTAQFSKKNFALEKPIQIRIPENSGAEKNSVFAQTVGTDTFFYYYRPIFASGREKALPQKITVWWDVSSSGENRDIEKEIAFLKAYIARLKNPDIAVYPFANEVHGGKQFKIKSEKEIAELEAWIRSFEYDGATNLGFNFTELGGEEILVFTDGLSNWDTSYAEKIVGVKNDVSALKNPPRLYTINSAPSADHAWLSLTAQKNGGQYINLSDGSLAESKLSLIVNEPYRLIRAEYDKNAVGDIFPEAGAAVSSDFALTGVLKKKSAEIKLYFGYGNTAEETATITVSAAGGMESDNVARQWAGMKINSLSQNYGKNKDEIVALAKKFGVVTKDTSLIVLDSAGDYARYGIVPPKSDEKLYAEYEKIVARQSPVAKPANGEESRAVPQSVYRLFDEFKKWWNTPLEEFKKKKKEPKKDGGIVRPLRNANGEGIIVENRMMETDAQGAPVYSDMSDVIGRAADRPPSCAVAPSAAKAAGAENGGALQTQTRIQLQAWSPDSEYLSILKKTPAEKMYQKYLELKKDCGSSPAFYMEVSDYFAAEDLQNESVRILSNLAELNLENTDVLRALANKLVERKMHSLAVPVFERLVSLKGEVPQFYRDLGMAYYLSGDAQKAVETLYSVAYKKWDGRFDQVQQIALNDMNAIIAECGRKKIALDLSGIDGALKENFDVDVRIVLTWNTDDCDVDLWVTDKDGEKCYYGNRITANGARLSRDFTQGYGPEEFCIRTAPGGKLKIEANYFGNHQQKLLQPVTVQAEVYTNFGRENQKREVLTLQLNEVKGTFLIGEVEF